MASCSLALFITVIVTGSSVVVAAPPFPPAAEIDAVMADLWPELQADLTKLSAAGSHRTVPGSGHFIQKDDPQAVVDAITRILDEVGEP